MMTLLLGLAGAAVAYSFFGTTTGIVLYRKLDATNLDDTDRLLWSIFFGTTWPAVALVLGVWSTSNKTISSLETRKQRKLLAQATVVSE
jgi:hypothetical protein